MTKKKLDSAKAAEMRNRALENLGGTQKRQRKDEVENVPAARAKRRGGARHGGILYLREKNDLIQRREMKEIQLQKRRLEAEGKKEEQSKKQHQDLMQVILQQTKQ